MWLWFLQVWWAQPQGPAESRLVGRGERGEKCGDMMASEPPEGAGGGGVWVSPQREETIGPAPSSLPSCGAALESHKLRGILNMGVKLACGYGAAKG